MRELDRGRELPIPRGRGELRAPRRAEARRFRLRGWLAPRQPFDALAALAAVGAVVAVLANGLALQAGPHPAPLFAEAPRKAAPLEPRQPLNAKRMPPPASAPAAATATVSPPNPPPRADTVTVRLRDSLVLQIQRELAVRGYYDGVVDGLRGPRTEHAIREFERAQGKPVTGEPSEALLGLMQRARTGPEATGSVPAPAPEPERSTRVLAVQRVLARLGYGPVRLTGQFDAATRDAIQRFERDRGLAPNGAIDDRLVQELSAVTGMPVE